jgi:hypothetical protein
LAKTTDFGRGLNPIFIQQGGWGGILDGAVTDTNNELKFRSHFK